ncbi:MAG: RtcB family protein, partial [Planctomycetes bacterium]|nr:RtcB family protein [Planctomycetota bacterium]
YPQAVGADIGCGIAAVRLHATAALVRDPTTTARLLAELHRGVPAVRHRRPRDVALAELSDPALHRRLQRDARVQLGTLGGGNHFLELQADADEDLWLAIHSGSRGLGPAIRDHHLARAGGGASRPRSLVGIPVEGAGADYLYDVAVAVEFAAANRRAIATAAAGVVADVLGAAIEWDSWFEAAHDTIACEHHGGRDLHVHRKGCNRAALGDRAVIPGSMGTRTFHVEGRGDADAMCSSAHGAGRRLARGAARRSLSVRELARQMRGVAFDADSADRLLDEAPSAYKDIGAVMRAQRDLVRIVRELRPVVAFKAR